MSRNADSYIYNAVERFLRMWKQIRKWLSLSTSEIKIPAESIGYQAIATGLDRRRHTRIVLPLADSPFFPKFFFQEIELPTVDLSIGGACLIDRSGHLGSEVGHELSLEIDWAGQRRKVTCRMIAQSKHIHRHVQFIDLDMESLTQITLLARAGGSGRKMRRLPRLRSTQALLSATELWTGVNGDCLAFFESGPVVAEITLMASTIRFSTNAPPSVVDSSRSTQFKAPQPVELAYVLTCLANVQYPSESIKQLETSICQGVALKPTGSES